MSVISPSPSTRPAVNPSTSRSRETSPTVASANPQSGFLFSPLIDLIFIANLFWPLLVFVDVFGGTTTHEGLLFWQIYFITAPHRWITIVLVSVDHHKSQDRRWLFAALALAILTVCVGLQVGTGSLLCLGMIDYIWNAWHFSSQHHGIFRIYQRQSSAPSKTKASDPFDRTASSGAGSDHSNPLSQFMQSKGALLQKLFFRGFLLYTIARVAGFGWPEGPFPSFSGVEFLDWGMLLIPAAFAISAMHRFAKLGNQTLASMLYLLSVMSLFAALLLAAHYQNSRLVIQLALASAIFHSMEYMSIVTWSMKKSGAKNANHPLARLSKIWMLFLVMFVLVIGLGNYLLSRGFFEVWVTINLVVAFWHYCFDGLLWKSPKRRVPSPSAGAA
ncbi:putative transmembrane protein [Rhodopirellula islandica]|uniref:Transmembrane protein n=1 Tax=Rhodopirellula islandica TaxID=595434 RepID=A0A0J1BC05_RHOIS|nr:hypothetical protein [Rhodopirellula islandica]KLU04041.1 putative transmembrane protein [Rhodopirellula islandica]